MLGTELSCGHASPWTSTCPPHSATLIQKDSWPLYPEDEVYALAVRQAATETGDGDVAHSSGSFLGDMGENDFLVI